MGTVSVDLTSSLAPGSTFAREYQIVRPLAQGGMGVVYVALQLGTMKERALKVMRPSLVQDPRNRERFLLEARAGAALRTDHVVDVIGAGIDEATGAPWIAMELLEGETLAAAVERRGAFSVRDARECFDQLRHALAAAHGAGLVHRDLKPENIFLATPRRADVQFTLKVLDFGIAKTLDGHTAAATSTSAGSPLWMTPEQANAQPVSTATDVWPLGLIAFWMLTGRYFWESPYGAGVTLAALLTEILIMPIEAPSVRAARSGVAARLPQGFDAWFARCVAREPSQRFREGNEALAALIALIDGQHAATAFSATIATNPGAVQPNALPATVAASNAFAQYASSNAPSAWSGSPPGTQAPWSGAPPVTGPVAQSPTPSASAGTRSLIFGVFAVGAIASGLVAARMNDHRSAAAPSVTPAPAYPSAPMYPSYPTMPATSAVPPPQPVQPPQPTLAIAPSPTPAASIAPRPAPTRTIAPPRTHTAPVASAPAPTTPAPSSVHPPITGRTAAIASLCDTADRLDASGNHAAAQQIRASAWGHLRSIESQVHAMQTSDPTTANALGAAATEERAYLTARLGHP